MSQSITRWKAFEILHKYYPEATEDTVDKLTINGEMHVYRCGSVDRITLDDVQRVLRSWNEQHAKAAEELQIQEKRV